MVDLSLLAVVALPVCYIIFYIWALVFRIIPWLNIPIIEIYKLTLLQMFATTLFITFGTLAFIVCLVFVIGILWGR